MGHHRAEYLIPKLNLTTFLSTIYSKAPSSLVINCCDSKFTSGKLFPFMSESINIESYPTYKIHFSESFVDEKHKYKIWGK